MSDPTVDDYCPPADPSDYFDAEIQYPTPEGKEWQDSRNPHANDLLIEPLKQEKNLSLSNIDSEINKLRIKKSSNRISTGLDMSIRKKTNAFNFSVSSNKTKRLLSFSSSVDKKRSNLI